MTDFGLISKVVDLVTSLIQKRQEKDFWQQYISVVSEMQKAGANTWMPPFGSENHQLAQEFVQKGWMKRDPGGFGYMNLAY